MVVCFFLLPDSITPRMRICHCVKDGGLIVIQEMLTIPEEDTVQDRFHEQALQAMIPGVVFEWGYDQDQIPRIFDTENLDGPHP